MKCKQNVMLTETARFTLKKKLNSKYMCVTTVKSVNLNKTENIMNERWSSFENCLGNFFLNECDKILHITIIIFFLWYTFKLMKNF